MNMTAKYAKYKQLEVQGDLNKNRTIMRYYKYHFKNQ